MTKTSSEQTPIAWLAAVAAAVAAPSTAPAGSVKRRIHLARQAVLIAATLVTLVQMIIWMIIAIATSHLDGPWWLWSGVVGVVAALGLTAADRLHDGYSEKG
ncbi:MAG TPA: hypothetical protein VGL93_36645 [Streptosporangiaceae bacterium]|jgi:hypothetical protein